MVRSRGPLRPSPGYAFLTLCVFCWLKIQSAFNDPLAQAYDMRVTLLTSRETVRRASGTRNRIATMSSFWI